MGRVTDVPRAWTHGAPMYALVTLVVASTAAVVSGGGERVWGIAVAWAIQIAAIWPLGRALSAGRDATRAWLGGIALRVGGLVMTGGLAVAEAATADLPVTYGISMLVLLLAEAAWLALGLGRRGAGETASRSQELDRTRKTG